jgi:hypothetical protein
MGVEKECVVGEVQGSVGCVSASSRRVQSPVRERVFVVVGSWMRFLMSLVVVVAICERRY